MIQKAKLSDFTLVFVGLGLLIAVISILGAIGKC